MSNDYDDSNEIKDKVTNSNNDIRKALKVRDSVTNAETYASFQNTS